MCHHSDAEEEGTRGCLGSGLCSLLLAPDIWKLELPYSVHQVLSLCAQLGAGFPPGAANSWPAW